MVAVTRVSRSLPAADLGGTKSVAPRHVGSGPIELQFPLVALDRALARNRHRCRQTGPFWYQKKKGSWRTVPAREIGNDVINCPHDGGAIQGLRCAGIRESPEQGAFRG